MSGRSSRNSDRIIEAHSPVHQNSFDNNHRSNSPQNIDSYQPPSPERAPSPKRTNDSYNDDRNRSNSPQNNHINYPRENSGAGGYPNVSQEYPIQTEQIAVPNQPYNPPIVSNEYPVNYEERPAPAPLPVQPVPYIDNHPIISQEYPHNYEDIPAPIPAPIPNKPYIPPNQINNDPKPINIKPLPIVPNTQHNPVRPQQPHHPVRPQQPQNPHNSIHPQYTQHHSPQPIIINNPPIILNTIPSMPTGSMYPDDDDPSAARFKVPNVPPPNIQHYISAYGPLGWHQKKEIPHPPVNLVQMSGNTPPASISKTVELSEEEVKRAFITFANSDCCFGKKPAQDAKIIKLIPSTALKYSLETFTEKRYISFVFKSYNGGLVDTYSNGPIPMVWSINMRPNEQFKTNVQLTTIPHTEQVMNCFRCGCLGKLRCSGCLGKGRKICSFCNGTRYRVYGDGQRSVCSSCNGQGTDQCIRCNGRGYKVCSTCHGSTKLVCFLQLEVVYTNHKDYYIIEKTDLPDDLIKTVSGDPLLLQTFPLVSPITECDYPDIVNNSQRIHNDHRRFFSAELPVLQRQILDAVLVIEVHYIWKDIESRFWVYGNEHQVFCPDYPQSCCGCCCCCSCCCACRCRCKCKCVIL